MVGIKLVAVMSVHVYMMTAMKLTNPDTIRWNVVVFRYTAWCYIYIWDSIRENFVRFISL